MLITIITVCFNSEKKIKNTIESVINQEYKEIEYIIIDGGSTDNTLKIINNYSNFVSKLVSEEDLGIYDAINKGIHLAKGDVIGILNSDDVFYDNKILSRIANYFMLNENIDSVIGDIVFQNNNNEIIRRYSSKNWNPNKFKWGIMPPHPSFYCKRKYFNLLGVYLIHFKIASDYELMMRFLLVNKITYKYLPFNFVKMSMGGVSTKSIKNNILINKEVIQACRLNKIKTNKFKIYSKYLFKIFEFLY